jgi:hypothetical protein
MPFSLIYAFIKPETLSEENGVRQKMLSILSIKNTEITQLDTN